VRPFRIAVPRLSSSKDDPPRTQQVKVPLPAASVSQQEPVTVKPKLELRENIYTIPNFLTVSRIVACPFLGYFIVQGNFTAATALLVYAGTTDWASLFLLKTVGEAKIESQIDGYLARQWNMGSVFGSILDPAADKALMTTLTIALAVKGLLPGAKVRYCVA
jgi:cardiolipin synthase